MVGSCLQSVHRPAPLILHTSQWARWQSVLEEQARGWARVTTRLLHPPAAVASATGHAEMLNGIPASMSAACASRVASAAERLSEVGRRDFEKCSALGQHHRGRLCGHTAERILAGGTLRLCFTGDALQTHSCPETTQLSSAAPPVSGRACVRRQYQKRFQQTVSDEPTRSSGPKLRRAVLDNRATTLKNGITLQLCPALVPVKATLLACFQLASRLRQEETKHSWLQKYLTLGGVSATTDVRVCSRRLPAAIKQ